MKKILFMIPLLALLFTACDPTSEDNGPGANISAEELNNGFTITQESDGNNNLTFNISPARYVKIYNADNNGLVAQGTGSLTTQVVPPVTSANYYVEAINPDGSIVKSSSKGVTVNNYTKLPAIFDQVFGKDANGNYLTSTWTWDDSSDKCLAGDGLPDAWFSLSLSEGVKTSRGETGTVAVNDKPSQQGWDIGTMTFSGTVPLLGVLPNDGNARCYKYQIIKATGDKLILAAQSSSGTEGWFLSFKKIPNK